MTARHTFDNPAVVSTGDYMDWSADAEDFCKRLADVVVKHINVCSVPVFKAIRGGTTSIDLFWENDGTCELAILWTPANETELDADLSPKRGIIEISVLDETDAILLSQRVIDLVKAARGQTT